MACLDMYNSEHNNKGHHLQNHHHYASSVSPRISFSNDFVDTHQQAASQQERSTRSDAPPVSTDFEFSVTNYSMMSADELFSKGRLLPFKDNGSNKRPTTTTLKEELLVGDDDDDECHGFSLRPPKGSSTRWKGFLGLRKSHVGSKKVDKSDSGVEARRSGLVTKGTTLNINSKDLLIEGGSSCRDFEFGI